MREVRKWLEAQGYTCNYLCSEAWQYASGTHKGKKYYTDLYAVTDETGKEFFIRAKENASTQKLYLLYRRRPQVWSDGLMLFDYTQKAFIHRINKYATFFNQNGVNYPVFKGSTKKRRGNKGKE